MSSPRVTVLLTVYNGLPYVSQTIDAVLDQTYDDFEFVVVDDGSDDDTRAKLETYDDSRMRTLYMDHVGRGAALNAGLMAAKGELIAIIDADDIPYPDRLEKQVQYFDDNPEIDVLGGWYDQWWTECDETEQVCPTLPEDDQIGSFTATNPLSHSTTMYRRIVAAKIGGYDEHLSTCIDYDFWIRLGVKGYRFDILEDPVCKIRKHEEQSFRVDGWDRLQHHWNSFCVRKEAIKQVGSSTDQINNVRRFTGEIVDWIRTQKERLRDGI